ncbi:hypothetical protein B0J11DRAFT_570868 [Dendryphion nanum]|uniref:Uncharacterized protein n=1 Tax=Dendryphion nanum TaxID=256645 RepID=A0A9P9IF46_9PLEO|nr:hypothetical protein B0J11DRAFT_570868 [Dendryphion nanum]
MSFPITPTSQQQCDEVSPRQSDQNSPQLSVLSLSVSSLDLALAANDVRRQSGSSSIQPSLNGASGHSDISPSSYTSGSSTNPIQSQLHNENLGLPNRQSPPQSSSLPPFSSPDDQATCVKDIESPNGRRTLWTNIYEWRWELFTWMLGTISLITITSLLLWFRDAPVSAWKSKVQFSAIVAALAQVAQSALLVPVASCIGQMKWNLFSKTPRNTMDLEMYDMASRGPEGSVKLLLQLPPPLVTLGALVTILMLFLQIFIQQSSRIHIRNVPIENYAAILPCAHRSVNNWIRIITFTADQSGMIETDPLMINAVRSGITEKNKSLADVTGSCPTSNCHWPKHNSLAICTSFENVTVRLEDVLSRKTMPYDYSTNNFTSTFGNGSVRVLIISLNYDELRQPHPESLTKTASQMMIVAENYLFIDDVCDNEAGHEDQYGRTVIKATMGFCVQSLEVNFNSKMNTRVLKEYKDFEWQGLDSSLILARIPDGNKDVFAVNNMSLLSVGQQVAEVVKLEAVLEYEWGKLGRHYANMPNTDPQWGISLLNDIIYEFSKNRASDYCQWVPQNITQLFKYSVNNVAVSITNFMRTSNSSDFVIGIAFEDLQFFQFEPAWLAMPAFMYITVTVLLIATIRKTNKTGTPVWKHTALGLLRGLGGEKKTMKKREVDQVVGKTSMQLVDQGDSWKLVGVDREETEAARPRKWRFKR